MASSMVVEEPGLQDSNSVVDPDLPRGIVTSWRSLPRHLLIQIFQALETLAESEATRHEAEHEEGLETVLADSSFEFHGFGTLGEREAVHLTAELQEGCGDWDAAPSQLLKLGAVCKEWRDTAREAVTVAHVHALPRGACFYPSCGGREAPAVTFQLSRLPNVTHLKFHPSSHPFDCGEVLTAALAACPRLTAITVAASSQSFPSHSYFDWHSCALADLAPLLLEATDPSKPPPATHRRPTPPPPTASAAPPAGTGADATSGGASGAPGGAPLLPTGIRHLSLRHGATLRAVSPAALAHLTTLHLHDCPQLMVFPPLTTAAPQLLDLHLSLCPDLSFSLTPTSSSPHGLMMAERYGIPPPALTPAPTSSSSTRPPLPRPLALTSLRLDTLAIFGSLDVTPAPALTCLEVLNCCTLPTLHGLSTLTALKTLSWFGHPMPWDSPTLPPPSPPSDPPFLFPDRPPPSDSPSNSWDGPRRMAAPQAPSAPLPAPPLLGSALQFSWLWGNFPLPGLTALHLKCPGAWMHALLCQLPLLEELQLTGVRMDRMGGIIPELPDKSCFLDPLAHMARLRRLHLRECAPVRFPEGLAELTGLTELRMKTIFAWEPPGAAAAAEEEDDEDYAIPSSNLPPLDSWLAPVTRLPNLLTLHIDGVRLNHAQLPSFRTLTSLREFSLHAVSTPFGPLRQHNPLLPPLILPAPPPLPPPHSPAANTAATTSRPPRSASTSSSAPSPLTTISLQFPAWPVWRTLSPRTVASLTHLKLCNVEQQPSFSLDPIGRLTALKTLTILGSVHSSKGSVPLVPTVHHLTALTRLNLAWCQMSGTKKKKPHRLPPSLGHLELICCSGRLFQLESLPLLHTLRLQDKFKTLPEEVPRLTSLTSLSLRSCENLRELPPNLGDLVELRVVDLRGSGLETLVEEGGGDASELFGLKPGVHLMTSAPHEDSANGDEEEVDGWWPHMGDVEEWEGYSDEDLSMSDDDDYDWAG